MPTEQIVDGYLDHGYARTNYKTQGATADRVFTLGDDGDLDQQAAYTALSRGRIENRLYMLEPDEDLQALLDPNQHVPQRALGRERILEHVAHELSRDRSQHRATEHLDPHAAELLASLPEPVGPSVGCSADDLLHQIPESVGPGTGRRLSHDLLADLPDPIDDQLAEDIAAVTARLDRLQHRESPALDDGFGIGSL